MGERDPGNKPQSNDRIPYCYIDTCNLKCKKCNLKVNPDNCKCVTCMNIYCSTHLKNHTALCYKICRFCKLTSEQTSLTNCLTCKGWYCNKCNDKHNTRNDKYKKIHYDKCKKPLTNKLLQGDTIEHPQYITEKNLKIDYNYYLTNQIEKPVYQIFELVMKKPESIIADLVRKMTNAKKGNHPITAWLKVLDPVSPVKIEKNVLKEKIIEINNYDEDENMLEDNFEEELIINFDELNIDDNDVL